MDVYNEVPVGLQLQSNLDKANKTLSEDQIQLLEQDIQQATGCAPDAGPRPVGSLVFRDEEMFQYSTSNQRKRKSNPCNDTSCGPNSLPTKRCPQVTDINMPSELQAGRPICDRSEWDPLKDENGFTLTPLLTPLLVCNSLNGQDAPSEMDTPDGGKGSTSKPTSRDPSSTLRYTGQFVPDYDSAEPVFVSTVARADLFLSFETTNAPLPQVRASTKLESTPKIGWTSGPDKSPQVDTSYQANESALDVAKLPQNNHVIGTLSTDLRWDTSPKRRANRTESERIQEFQTDLFVAEVEPYRVLCALCNKWIKLRNNSRYCSIPWKCHRDGCTRMYGISDSSPMKASALLKRSHRRVQSNPTSHSVANNMSPPKVDLLNVPPPSVHPSLQLRTMPPLVSSSQSIPSTIASGSDISITFESQEPRHMRLRDADQRRAILESDPYTEIVEPNRILCFVCKKWVKLRLNSTYCSAPWYNHIQRCLSRKKKAETAKGSVQADDLTYDAREDLDPDMPSGSHHRETCDAENAYNIRSADEQVRKSYNEGTSTIQDLFASQVAKKRRGHPPKNKTLETKAKRVEDGMDSYESEEQ